ncbi:hypothetical protein TorRG33x02_337190, partial [Trema orientale]
LWFGFGFGFFFFFFLGYLRIDSDSLSLSLTSPPHSQPPIVVSMYTVLHQHIISYVHKPQRSMWAISILISAILWL